jgi:ABC-type phosphate transport system substrate-binding protein
LLRAEHPIDFAISDAPLTDAEVASLKSPIVHLPITLTALQFVYNLPDDQIRSVCSRRFIDGSSCPRSLLSVY